MTPHYKVRVVMKRPDSSGGEFISREEFPHQDHSPSKILKFLSGMIKEKNNSYRLIRLTIKEKV
jgi:hypothetical protein